MRGRTATSAAALYQPGMLESVPPAHVDATFKISVPVPVPGAYVWCPPMRAGRLDLRRPGLSP